MGKLEVSFTKDRDTKNTRRYAEDPGAGPPVIGTLYVQQWALKQLNGGELPDRVRVTVEVEPEAS